MQAVMQDKTPAVAHPSFWAPFVIVGEGAAQ
jgi:CHAT domain-containing protein